MNMFAVPVTLYITAKDADEAAKAAFTALTDAFEDYERDDFSFEDENLVPYLHADDWRIHAGSIEQVSYIRGGILT